MSTMRALVLTGPGRAEVQEVEVPLAGSGGRRRARSTSSASAGRTRSSSRARWRTSARVERPIRCGPVTSGRGVVEAVGDGVDASWVGRRVTGHTMLGCGACDRCRGGRRNVCRDLVEVGISSGIDGALAEQLRVPASSLLRLPDTVDDQAGALVEPGGNAWRASTAAQAGPGSGCWSGAPARSDCSRRGLRRRPGRRSTWSRDERPGEPDLARRFGVSGHVDAGSAARWPDPRRHRCHRRSGGPGRGLPAVEPGGRVVYIGLRGSPSRIDSARSGLRRSHRDRHPRRSRRDSTTPIESVCRRRRGPGSAGRRRPSASADARRPRRDDPGRQADPRSTSTRALTRRRRASLGPAGGASHVLRWGDGSQPSVPGPVPPNVPWDALLGPGPAARGARLRCSRSSRTTSSTGRTHRPPGSSRGPS